MGKKRPGHLLPDRIPFVEGLRGFAALYVVLSHLCSMSDPSYLAGKASTAPIWFQRLIAPFAYGHLAVAAFIVISGFCLQLSLFSSGEGRIKSSKRFFIRRAKRILPAYYGALALSLLIAIYITPKLYGMPFALYLPVTRENVLAHVFMVHNFSTAWMYKLNGVLWSISIEAQLYLIFPLIVLGLFRFGRFQTVGLSWAVALLALAFVPNALKLYPWFLPLFAIGMTSAHLVYRPHPRIGLRAGIAQIIAATSVVVCIFGVARGWPLPATDAFIGLAVASLCYYGTISKPTFAVRFLSSKPLLVLGAFSYSLYLIHNPVQQLLYWLRPTAIVGPVADFCYLVATLPLIIGCAWLFSLAFERPFLTKKVKADPATDFVPVSLPLQTAASLPRRAVIHMPAPVPRSSGAVLATSE